MNHLRLTEAELAALCGVSQGTVDRALKGRAGISAQTKEKILETARLYGWRPSSGNSKVPKEQPTIGIIVFNLSNDFFSKLISDFEQAAKARGILTTVLFTHYDPAEEISCLRWLHTAGVDGIILCSVNSGPVFENFLKQFLIPVIAVGNRTGNIPYVGIDDLQAMKAAALSLAEEYSHIIYYSPALRYPNAFAQQLRYRGFLEAVASLLSYQVITSPDELADCYSSDTAVLCSTDYYALQVYTKLPKVKIAGFDNLSILDKLHLPIDSVDYDTSLIARSALQLISDKTQQDILIPHQIIKRIS